MNDVETLVSGIEYKFGKLMEVVVQLREENNLLKSRLESSKQIIENQNIEIKQQEEKLKVLKLAKTLETTEGSVEAKLKINELVREIDKCIGLLNT